jgi:hypothetical protein
LVIDLRIREGENYDDGIWVIVGVDDTIARKKRENQRYMTAPTYQQN